MFFNVTREKFFACNVEKHRIFACNVEKHGKAWGPGRGQRRCGRVKGHELILLQGAILSQTMVLSRARHDF